MFSPFHLVSQQQLSVGKTTLPGRTVPAGAVWFLIISLGGGILAPCSGAWARTDVEALFSGTGDSWQTGRSVRRIGRQRERR